MPQAQYVGSLLQVQVSLGLEYALRRLFMPNVSVHEKVEHDQSVLSSVRSELVAVRVRGVKLCPRVTSYSLVLNATS